MNQKSQHFLLASLSIAVLGIIFLLRQEITVRGANLTQIFEPSTSNELSPYPPPYPPPDASEQPPPETIPYPPPTTIDDATPIETNVVSSFSDALNEDAAMYASIYGVSLDEAVLRLKLQDVIGELNSALSEQERATFAGLWIQHQPDYRVIIQFTRAGGDTIQPYLVDSPLIGIIELRTAAFNLNDLEESRSQAAQLIRELGIPSSSAINIRENRVELYVPDLAQVNALLQSEGLQLPSNTHLTKMNDLGREVEDIYGGLALTTCTSGFSVIGYSIIDNAVVMGVTTAGHCNNSQSYNGTQLPWLGGTPDSGGDYDIQWHKGEHAFNVKNRIALDGSSIRSILDVKSRSEQTLGDFVCKKGMVTGYDCGTIAEVGVNGINVRVDILVEGGDSGGPWFLGNIAYGTTIYSCELGNGDPCVIYGPVDQIYEVLGLTIMTGSIYLPLIMK